MDKLNDAIMEAYKDYQTALDYVKGWKKEAADEVEESPVEEEATAGEEQEAPADA